jgi:hypothetical protein
MKSTTVVNEKAKTKAIATAPKTAAAATAIAVKAAEAAEAAEATPPAATAATATKVRISAPIAALPAS